MKYWKKSNGDCGTIDDNGYVPDSIEILEVEYSAWIKSLPVVDCPAVIIEFKDIESGKTYRMKRINNEVENVKNVSMVNSIREWCVKRLP